MQEESVISLNKSDNGLEIELKTEWYIQRRDVRNINTIISRSYELGSRY